jgi:hypothetical protein
MAIDAGIYNQLKYPDPNGLSGMLDTYQQGKEHQVDRKNKLAELAQEQQLQGFKIAAAKRAEAAIPQQQADAQRQREAEYMRGVSRDISNNPQNADALLQKYAQDAPQQGVNPEHITWLAQDLSTAKDPAELADKAYFHSLDEKQQAEYQSKKRLQSSGADEVFKEVEGSDGKMYGITKSGKTIPLAVGGQQISGKVAPIDYNKPFNADGSPNLAFQRYQQSLKPQKDDNTKPPAGYRFTDNGDLQAIPGGPADIKEQAKSSAQETGRENVSSTIAQLRDAYTQLNNSGGITDPNAGTGHNIIAGIGSSGVGQFTGRMLGTQNQSKRNEILMTRPSLLQHIMKATGMSAKQMDSNAELKLWLSTATDPTLDIAANINALDNLERVYGLSGAQGQPVKPTGNPHANKTDAQIKAELGL